MLKLTRADPPTLSDDMIKHITDFARERGFRATIHSSTEPNSTAAILNGVSALAHPVLRSQMSDAFIKLVVDHKIPISTTTVGFITNGRLLEPGGMAYLDSPLFKATMLEADLAAIKGPERDEYIKTNVAQSMKSLEPLAKSNIKRLFDGGVILTSGTDKAYGGYTHMELAFLNEAGISAFDLIKVATLNGATYIGREKDFGSVQPGKYADLLVLNADPGADVKNFQAISAVIKNGQEIDRTKLDLPVNHRM
jgi:imidazolonepropionase-like amidohydrolase